MERCVFVTVRVSRSYRLAAQLRLVLREPQIGNFLDETG